jgi:RNA polymerase sigma-70 factor (ECF subfamily)
MLVTSDALRAARTLAEYATLSDNELVGAMTHRDQKALRVLMVRHQLRIGRFLRRFIADRDLVEDLVADTFFAAWQQAPRFEQRSAVATWLLAIARYKALSARSRRTLPTTSLDDAVTATLVDSGLRADAILEREDRAHILRQCLASLPAEQALLLNLVYYRDKSIKEAATLAGITEDAVKSRMFQARRKLAAMLDATEADPPTVSLVSSSTLPKPGTHDLAADMSRKRMTAKHLALA